MNYPIIRDFKLDINQEFAVNKIPNERRVLDDEQNVFVPRHAPFFMESLTLRDRAGRELVDGVDYRIFRMMGALSATCASPIACLIEMIDTSIKDVYADYHAVGSSPLFDRSLIELINDSANDQRLIKWSKIKNKPVVFDPELHTHLLPYDIVMFQDVIDLVDLWAEGLDTLSPSISPIALQTQTNLVKKYFDRNSAIIQRALERHVNQHNEHGLTDAQVNLDKVENIPTATLDQALNGEPRMRLLTSSLKQIINRFGYNSDAFLKSNVLPISFYGNTSFIPPAIGGSFEGLGSQHEGAAICLESDGTISYLSNHFDGRSEGLYFSIITGYPNTLKMNYQSYRYTHPVLTAKSQNPNVVAQGSGGEVLMLGSTRTRRWFIALTNGTLDPGYHVMCELDVSGFDQNFLQTDYLSVHLMGDYVVIVQAMNNATGGENIGRSHRRIWRLAKNSFVSGNTLTPTPMKLSFTNQDGRVFTNSDYFVWAEIQRDGNGLVTRLINRFTSPLNLTDVTNTFYRTAATVACAIPNRPGIFLMKFLSHSFTPGSDATRGSYSTSRTYEINYEFNVFSGVMTQVQGKASPLIDTSNPLTITAQTENYWGGYENSWLTQMFAQNCTMPFSDGNLLVSQTDSAFRTPHGCYLVKTGAKSPYETLSKRLEKASFPNLTRVQITEAIASPLAYSIYPAAVSWSGAGEFFNAVTKYSNGGREIFFREVSGEYSVRSSLTNLDIGNIYSRPLSNAVYRTGIPYGQPRVGVSGDATFLSNSGLNFGATSLGVGVEGRIYKNPHSAWASVVKSDRTIVLARTNNNFKINSTDWNFLPTSFITYPDAMVRQIAKALIPAAYQDSPDSLVSIADVSTIPGNVGTKPILVQVVYGDVKNQARRHAVATIRVTYNQADANNWIVTGFTVISSGDIQSMNQQLWLTPTQWEFGYGSDGQGENVVGLYYSGNTIRVAFNTLYRTSHIGNSACCGTVFTVDTSTQAVSNLLPNYNQSWEGANNQVVIPKVGMGGKYNPNVTGATAEIVNANGTVYALISCYPDPAWTLFFQTDIDVIFNGKSYQLGSGAVDLRSIKSNPGNTKFYLYARLVNGVATYVISETKTFDTIYNIWIGTVTTNTTQIIDITRFNALLLNGSRVSEVKRGGAIPAVTGAITEEGQMAWIRTPEIIQG